MTDSYLGHSPYTPESAVHRPTAVAVLTSALLAGLSGGLWATVEDLESRLKAQARASASEASRVDVELRALEAAIAEATAPRFLASAAASGHENFDRAVVAGLAYWQGRNGRTPDVQIRRTKTNPCGPDAVGCAQQWSDGTCRIWIDPAALKDRWASTAIGLHEVGHCTGHAHDESDLVMHP